MYYKFGPHIFITNMSVIVSGQNLFECIYNVPVNMNKILNIIETFFATTSNASERQNAMLRLNTCNKYCTNSCRGERA